MIRVCFVLLSMWRPCDGLVYQASDDKGMFCVTKHVVTRRWFGLSGK